MATLIDSGEIKQIIVVTDGRSNTGISPVEAAKRAYEAGITAPSARLFDIKLRLFIAYTIFVDYY